MKLATLRKKNNRDGELIVVSKDNRKAVSATDIAPNLRVAIETWRFSQPKLSKIYNDLNLGPVKGEFKLDFTALHSPLPRSFQWADGSAYLHHVKLVRKARGAEMPESFFTVPLMYQGGSDCFLAPTDDIPQVDFSHGTDFEGEVAVIVDDVPMGVGAEEALNHIQLVMLVNDVSLRGLIPAELAAGFGFFHGKPSSAFSPLALTLDEFGDAWSNGKLNLPLMVNYNGKFFGRANASEMHFHFGQLISHAAKTRELTAGTIIGSGTVSNEDPQVGSSCLAEKRMIEIIEKGRVETPFMKDGDTIEIFMTNSKDEDLFGRIFQRVRKV